MATSEEFKRALTRIEDEGKLGRKAHQNDLALAQRQARNAGAWGNEAREVLKQYPQH